MSENRFEEIQRELGALRRETEENFRQTRVLIEDLHSTIQTVAEGVVSLNEKLDRRDAHTSAQIGEVVGLVRFSHADLDGRVRRLEQGSDLT